MQVLLYLSIAASYLGVFRRPAWALVPLLVVAFSLTGYLPGTPITFRLAVALLSCVLVAGLITQAVGRKDPALMRVVLPTIAFMGVVGAINLLHSDIDFTFRYFRYQLTQLMAVFIVSVAIRDRNDLKPASWTLMIIALLSAIAAVSQHYSPSTALYTDGGGPNIINRAGGRSIGLSPSPVLLANDMATVLMPTLGVLICRARPFDRIGVALIGLTVMFAVGVYLTYTRSAAIGVAVGLLVVALFLKGRRRNVVLGLLLAALVIYEVGHSFGFIGARYYKSVQNDSSAATHLALWQVGLSLALNNTVVGVGHNDFQDVVQDYTSAVDVSSKYAANATNLSGAHPHNDFLNVWFSWGILALLTYIMVFVGALRNCVAAVRGSSDPLVRGLALGSLGGLVSYAVASTFHNYLDSSAYLWMYAGLSVVAVHFAASSAGPSRQLRLLMLRSLTQVSSARRRAARSATARGRRVYRPAPV